jgi:hypothetical protein
MKKLNQVNICILFQETYFSKDKMYISVFKNNIFGEMAKLNSWQTVAIGIEGERPGDWLMFKLHFQGKGSVLDKCDTCLSSLCKINTQEYTGGKRWIGYLSGQVAKCPRLLCYCSFRREKE